MLWRPVTEVRVLNASALGREASLGELGNSLQYVIDSDPDVRFGIAENSWRAAYSGCSYL